MKSAEQIADEVIEQCWEQTELSKPVSAKKILAQALTAYADEKLEEAAKVAEATLSITGVQIAVAIRDIKSTPAPGGAK